MTDENAGILKCQAIHDETLRLLQRACERDVAYMRKMTPWLAKTHPELLPGWLEQIKRSGRRPA